MVGRQGSTEDQTVRGPVDHRDECGFYSELGPGGKGPREDPKPKAQPKAPRLCQAHSRCSRSHGHSEALSLCSLAPLQA